MQIYTFFNYGQFPFQKKKNPQHIIINNNNFEIKLIILVLYCFIFIC